MHRSTSALLAIVFAIAGLAQNRDERDAGAYVRSLNKELRRSSGASRDHASQVIRLRAQALRNLIETDPKLALSLALPPGTAAEFANGVPGASSELESEGEWEGPAEVSIEDDFEHGLSRTRIRIENQGEMVDVFFAGAPPKAHCGQSIKVKGIRLGSRIAAASAAIDPSAALSFCSTIGPQNVAVLLVSFPHTPFPASPSASLLQTAFFGAGRSLDSYWREASYGKTSATGAVFGPFVLDADYTCDQTDAIRIAAIKAADGTVDFRNYTRIFVIVPHAGTCSIGYGLVGCSFFTSPSKGIFNASSSVLRADYLTSNDAVVSAASHEAGHNLGLQHAGTLDFGSVPLGPPGAAGVRDEYGDNFSTMASSYSSGANFVIGHYAAPHKSQMGWFSGANQQTIQNSGTFLVQPYETATSALQALRVRRGTGNNAWLWLEYRQPVGNFDPSLSYFGSQPFSGALIHYDDPANTAFQNFTQLLDFNPSATPNSFRDAALAAGTNWSDPYSDLSLTVNSATSAGLSVTVNFSTPCVTLPVAPPPLAPSGASNGTVAVTAAAACAWSAVSNASWIGIVSGASGNGAGTVGYALSANTGPARTGSISIGGATVTISQAAGCTFGIGQTGQSLPASGGSATVTVTAGAGCAWTAVSNASWIAIVSGASGSGVGSVAISVAANAAGDRAGTATIAGQSFTVTQGAAVLPVVARMTDSDFVTRLYQYILARPPEAAGFAHWLANLSAGEPRGQVADEFIRSPEYASYGLFIVSCYLGVLGREPELAGYQFWFALMRNQGFSQLTVINNFLASVEYQARFGNPDNATFVTRLYNNVLGRAPEQAGFDFWMNLLITGQKTRPEVVQGFVSSVEFQATTLKQLYVELAYFALLNRAGTPAELTAGKQAIASGQTTAAFLESIVNGAEFLARP